MTEEETQRLVAFVREETRKTRRGVLWTYLVGLLFFVLLTIYLVVILENVKEIMEPDMMADYVHLEFKNQLPDLLREAERTVESEAPSVAADLSNHIIETEIPRLGEMAQKQIQMVPTDIIPAMSDDFSRRIRQYVDMHHFELQEFAKTHSDQELADEFAKQLIAELTKGFDRELELETDRDLAYFNENVMMSILAADLRLNELIAMDPAEMTYEERLERKILAGLTQSFLTRTEDSTAAE